MKLDNRVLLCCTIALLCSVSVKCHFAGGNTFEENTAGIKKQEYDEDVLRKEFNLRGTLSQHIEKISDQLFESGDENPPDPPVDPIGPTDEPSTTDPTERNVCDIKENIEECAEKNAKCKAKEEEEGEFECICKKGDEEDGSGKCIDVCELPLNIDVCEEKKGKCTAKEDEELGFECTCKKGEGKHANGTCIDVCEVSKNIEVCEKKKGKCNAKEDEELGFECTCKKGEGKHANGTCIDVCDIPQNVELCKNMSRKCNATEEKEEGFECICKKGDREGDSGNCIDVCDIKENIEVCEKKKGKCKAKEEEEKGFECICKKGGKVDDAGNCIDVCDIPENIELCKTIKGKCNANETVTEGFECICEKGYEKNMSGVCEECQCGENSEKCFFKKGVKTCKCKPGNAPKNGICEECNCGDEKAVKICSYDGDNKICNCKANYSDNGGKCEACNCGPNSTNCEFKDGKIECTCKAGNAQKGTKCEECKCGENTKRCRFEGDNKICDCLDNYAKKGEKCTACNCGSNSKGCSFDEEIATCVCDAGYGSNDGKCKEDFCNTRCGVVFDEDHPEVECKGDRFFSNVTCHCIFDEEKEFDYSRKECRTLCEEDTECQNGAQCKENNDNKFCKCLKGTTGNKCESITACLSDGMYARCEGNKGTCVYDPESQKAICNCTANMQFDIKAGHCQDKCTKDDECKNGKTCYNKQYCACEDGKTGDNCEIITGCTDELKKKCEAADAECVFTKEETTRATCGCNKKDYIYDKGQNECIAKFCKDVGCAAPAKCKFNENTNTGFCSCPAGKYYDYNRKVCVDPDKCLLKMTPCKENEECSNGECKCMYEKKDDKCLSKTFCTNKACVKGANCSEADASCFCEEGKFYSGSECKESKCILDAFEEKCCPTEMKLNDETKKCEPKTGKACDKNCGLGYCVDDKCICVGGALTTKVNGTCVLNPENVCASKQLTADLSKCSCTGKYKQAKDGVTCELITCSDDIANDECKLIGATCKMQWTGNNPGYFCECPKGYKEDKEKGICTDSCSFYENIDTCQKNQSVCYNSFSTKNPYTINCDCPPLFKAKGRSCSAIATDVYLISGIPVLKEKYEIQNGIDFVKLNAHMMQSLSTMFSTDIFASGYLKDYVVEDKILKCSAWVRFKTNPGSELKRLPFQAQSFPNGTCNDCDTDLYVWPPNLLLSKNDIGKVEYVNLTLCELKDEYCGKEALCKDNKCYCPKGYRVLQYTVQNVDGMRILRCEATTPTDLDECALGTHKCSKNTTCVKTPGSYFCKCNPGFKKDTENDQNDCFDLCSPSPCSKGSCSMKKTTFNCKCDPGYGGSLCDETDVNYASAKKSTVVVGAVLGTILIVATLAALFYILKKRKNSYSEDFMPAARVDHASEMRERRPMRGVVNTSYE